MRERFTEAVGNRRPNLIRVEGCGHVSTEVSYLRKPMKGG